MMIDGRIAVSARRLRGLAGVLAVAMVLGTGVALLRPPLGPFSVLLSETAAPRTWTEGVSIVVAGLVVTALLRLRAMLRRIEGDRVFSPAASRCLRGFATLTALACAVEVFGPPLGQLAGAITTRHGVLTVTADDAHILLLFLSILFFLLARIFDQAARFEEDSRAVV